MIERAGEPPARPDIHALIADHHAPLYAYAYRLCGNADEAEDLTQQTFLIAHQKGDQIRDAAKARGWLFRVLRNAFLKSRRKLEPSKPGPVESEMDAIAGPIEADPVDRQRLEIGLAKLAEPYRVVLLMFYFEDLSYQEIADELDIKIGTVMSRLARAKSRLRSELVAAAEDGSLGVTVSVDTATE